MKKIPTLFKRVFNEEHKKGITDEVTPGCEWILGDILGLFWDERATVKYDGACCAILNGELFKRYDAKQKYGKVPPEGAIPCQPEPDPITGHWPHWVKCEEGKPEDRYFLNAFHDWFGDVMTAINRQKHIKMLKYGDKEGFTCEAIGKHFNGNPYRMEIDMLKLHGRDTIPHVCLTSDGYDWDISFESIREYLRKPPYVEGIVFWKDGEPNCKIKRSDFGFEWPIKKG